MINTIHHPLLVFALTFAGLWLSARIGWSLLRRQRSLDAELREDFGFILAATLTLLGLIIGFSFSMATSRYDQRKNYEEAEANAIGTEFVRADLLPPADAVRVRTLLRKYLDERVLFYKAGDEEESQQINARTALLQNEMWSAIRAPARAGPTPGDGPGRFGHERRFEFAGIYPGRVLEPHPNRGMGPDGVVAIGCNLLIGYGSRSTLAGSRLLPILPLVVAVAFMLIADIDSPAPRDHSRTAAKFA